MARALVLSGALALSGAIACERTGTAAVPPSAEFLIAAGDSTYWITTGSNGVRLRTAPILLTQADGRFVEIFVADDGIDYADAEFGTSRLWARDLLRGDSLLLFGDSSVMREAAAWKRRHREEEPLDPDDEGMDVDPRTSATETIEVVDVHGPYLTLTHLLDIDLETSTPHRHEGRQWVIDVRTGRAVSVVDLLGAGEAARLLASARASFARLADSIRATTDVRGAEARETLDSFRFDSSSFAITDVDRRPALAFMIPGKNAEGEALALYLPPIEVAPPAWWGSVGRTLPDWARDSSTVGWTRGRYRVSATPMEEGERLTLTLTMEGSPAVWPLATVASPAYSLVALDAPAVDTTVRRALARAFDATTALDGLTQRASYVRPARR